MRLFFILVLLLVTNFAALAQSLPVKYYCPPCHCRHDATLFDNPGICPDPTCHMELLPVQGDYKEQKLKTWVTFLRSNWLLRIYDILILPAVIQGIILSLILLFRQNANRLASRFLAALIIALSLQNMKFYYSLNLLVNYITNTNGNPDYGIQFLSFPVSGVLFIGPSLFFYVQSLTSSDFKFPRSHLFHFIPGFIFTIINAIAFISAASASAPTHASTVSVFSAVSSTENFLAIALSFYYIVLSIRLVHRHERWVFQHFSSASSKSLKWLRNLIVSLSLVWIVWLFAVVINFFTHDFILTYLSSYPFQILTSVIIFWIGYVGFIEGELFSTEISFEKKIDNLNTVSEKPLEAKNEVRKALLRAMEMNRLFLVPDLTLAMLSHQLNLSPRSISQTLNSDLNINFHDFINAYRVDEVKKRLPDPQYAHLTILAIALDSGFNSKSSFNRIFMKATGVSPKEFKEGKQGKYENSGA
jgi:AraC-like DNA-binding protein